MEILVKGKSKGDTADNKEKRLQALEKILDKFDSDGIKPTQNEILAELKKKKFTITRITLYKDMSELAINDPFVQDLADKTYSKLVHDSFNSIEFAEQEARKILKKKWTRSKTVTKDIPTKEGLVQIEEIHTTEQLAEPHLKAIQEIRECAAVKIKLLGGDIIKASAKKWSIQRVKDQQEIIELKAHLKELKSKSK